MKAFGWGVLAVSGLGILYLLAEKGGKAGVLGAVTGDPSDPDNPIFRVRAGLYNLTDWTGLDLFPNPTRSDVQVNQEGRESVLSEVQMNMADLVALHDGGTALSVDQLEEIQIYLSSFFGESPNLDVNLARVQAYYG